MAILGAALPGAASADITQHQRAIDVVLHPTYADVSVMVSMTNRADVPDAIDGDAPPPLPVFLQVGAPLGGGFATDLSMMITPADHAELGLWRHARLTEATTARDLFATAFDASEGGHAVGVYWPYDSYGSISATVGANETTSIAYKIVLPIDVRSHGRCITSLDGFGDGNAGTLHVRLGEGMSNLVVDDVAARDGLATLDASGGNTVSFDAPTTDMLSGDIAVIRATDPSAADSAPKDEKVVIDAYVDTATRLAEVPKDAHVVVVVDNSKSVDAATRDGLLAAARAYVSHFGSSDAKNEVAIVTFDRSASSTGFLPPAEATTTLRTISTTARRNGSNLDAAFAEAARLLGPFPGPKRVVVFSDLATPKRLKPADVDGVLPAGTLLHVVGVSTYGSAWLDRDDANPWHGVAEATGGLAWSASADGDSSEARTVFEELARPVRLDHVRVTPALDSSAGYSWPTSLEEGERAHLAILDAPIEATFTVEAELWSTKVKQTIHGTAPYQKLAAGRLFTDDALLKQLDPGRRKEAAWLAHALSPDTSFILLEGSGGYGVSADEGGRLGGSHRSRGPRGYVDQVGSADAFGQQAALEAAIRPLARICGAPAGVRVLIDSTDDEIVDVAVEGAPSVDIEACLVEATWEVDLSPGFQRFPARSWVVEL